MTLRPHSIVSELGHNLMDHHLVGGAWGRSTEFQDRCYRGRRPVGVCVPRFRNVTEQRKDYLRGFYYGGGAQRGNWMRTIGELSLTGDALEEQLGVPGEWIMGLGGVGECLPYHDNRVSLSPDQLDAWGLTQLSIHCAFRDNEANMRADVTASAAEMLGAGGLRDVQTFSDPPVPGAFIHEMGTARTGRDPKTSVLNGFNQVHAVPNVFVTDGACMSSSACQNPSLTCMALTARAAAHAVSALRKRDL